VNARTELDVLEKKTFPTPAGYRTLYHPTRSLVSTLHYDMLAPLYTGCFRRNIEYFRRWYYGLFRV